MLALLTLTLACRPDPCADGDAALSTCLQPTQSEDYYVAQSMLYFDSMDSRVEPVVWPEYGELVARWEWPPWLKLTAFGLENIEATDTLLRLYPSIVEDRDCRFFDTQPFGRCRVVFAYEAHDDRPCPIYEEFTFDDAGDITFIEAWSDLPEYLPTGPDDPWAEGDAPGRLSTRVPGLGSPSGMIDLDGPAMTAAAAEDPDVADFVTRAEDWYDTWTAEVAAAGDDMWEVGCGW